MITSRDDYSEACWIVVVIDTVERDRERGCDVSRNQRGVCKSISIRIIRVNFT